MSAQDPIVIVSAKRTAIGNLGGGLSSLPASKLGEAVIRAVLSDAGAKAEDVDQVILGQVLTGLCGQNPARQSALNAGIHRKKRH